MLNKLQKCISSIATCKKHEEYCYFNIPPHVDLSKVFNDYDKNWWRTKAMEGKSKDLEIDCNSVSIYEHNGVFDVSLMDVYKRNITCGELFIIIEKLLSIDNNIVFTKFKFKDEFYSSDSDSDSDEINISPHIIIEQF